MQSAVEEKKKLELRLDNINGELNKAKARASELESSQQQLQVCTRKQLLLSPALCGLLQCWHFS